MSSPRIDALINAAEEEFANAGFDAASLRKIMRAAGSDPGAIHYHFGGCDALAVPSWTASSRRSMPAGSSSSIKPPPQANQPSRNWLTP